nr:hypothetical protein CFP56_21435 [Quercus suber]
MTHILESQLKLAIEEADGEKALKKVAESTLQEKVQELVHMEQRALEGKDSASMRELAKQIDSHVVVVDLDNPASPVAPEDTGTSEVALASTAPSFGGASPVLPDAAQDPSP